MNDDLGEFVGKGFAMLRDRLKAVEARKALDGIDGQDGKDGKDGTNGTDGQNGSDGVDGTDGINGVDGAVGVDGSDGSDGTNALDGADGADGTDGTDGQDGISGKDGKDGLDGTDGKDATATDGDDGLGIADAKVDTRGHLILTLTDGTTKDAGKVKGKDGQSYQGMIASGPSGDNLARVFFGSVDLIIGGTTFVHGLNLNNQNAFTIMSMVNNSSVNLDVDSVDKNTIILTSLVAQADVKITVIGA